MTKYTLNLPKGYKKHPLPGRNEWTAALRSGKYRKGTGALRVGQKHCCLGVLCSIQGRLEKSGSGDWHDMIQRWQTPTRFARYSMMLGHSPEVSR